LTFVITEKEQKYVYKEVNGRKSKTKITTGESVDSLVEVTSGLKEGDTIVN